MCNVPYTNQGAFLGPAKPLEWAAGESHELRCGLQVCVRSKQALLHRKCGFFSPPDLAAYSSSVRTFQEDMGNTLRSKAMSAIGRIPLIPGPQLLVCGIAVQAQEGKGHLLIPGEPLNWVVLGTIGTKVLVAKGMCRLLKTQLPFAPLFPKKLAQFLLQGERLAGLGALSSLFG